MTGLGRLRRALAATSQPLFSAAREFRSDIESDPELKWVLALAVLTCGFGIWFRVPNFAGPDEYSRLLQPMKVAGEFVSDPSYDALVRGITDGRALGATFYLYAVILLPVFLVVLASGQLGTFAGLGVIESRWTLWHATPAWFWTLSVLLGRLVNVILGVGCVYLTYRLGVELRDRRAGQLAALALSLSVGFLAITHLMGEDVPMLFFLLLTVLLAHRYVESGRRQDFLLGALAGAFAIAFKLSGGAGAVALGVAHVERARRTDDTIDALARPRVVLGGLLLGLATIYVGMPSVLVGGPSELFARITGSIASKTTRTGGLDASRWYWLLRQSVQGLGLPLVVVTLVGVCVAVGRAVVRWEQPRSMAVLSAAVAAVFLAVYLRWEFVRVRHMVPLFPFGLAVASAEASRWYEGEHARQVVRVGLAIVLVTTAAFAGTAGYGYVAEPRDGATAWLAESTDPGDTVEVYENSIADVAAVHGRELNHYDFPEENATNRSSLVADEVAYTRWMLNVSDRRPEYIQLTGAELDYLDPTSTDYRRFPRRRAYIRDLLAGKYNYTVVAEFGHQRQAATLREDFRQAAFDPDVEGQEEYVVILERET